MNLATRSLLLSVIASTAAYAQLVATPQRTIQHVIIVIQENRTIDNLFGSNPTFLPGLNIATSGKIKGKPNITLFPQPMLPCYGLGHNHASFTEEYDDGAIDGFYENKVYLTGSCTAPADPEYSYVDNRSTTNPPNAVQPYFDIATQFGFANYMFQTNQGPSFPAHQFLFSGTSAPVYNDGESTPYYEWFAAENALNNGVTGCFGAPTNTVLELGPGQTMESPGWTNPNLPGATPGYPCYNHNTIANLLDPAGISWRYYTHSSEDLWTAPNAFQTICNSTVAGDGCVATAENPDWNYVIDESTKNDPPNPGQILQDIQNCNLAQVSWVLPDGAWSDHSGDVRVESQTTAALGPSWVGSIVNSIGQGMAGSTCNPLNAPIYWSNTVILVTWDDWGGYYDHVKPPSIGYINTGGSGSQYVYGFRVPLLVVSAYSPKPGYVSGAAANNSVITCPMKPTPRYCHDFGSILNFVEFVFGNGNKSLGEIYPAYHYADYYALDGPNNTTCKPSVCPYGLSDFFNFALPPAVFTPISTPYNADYFINYTGAPQDPDDD
ncbi:MAG: alkaline phosphatase family protein [Candidatus Sulfotelmatobacter sp.]